MRIKLDDYHNKESLIGKMILYFLRDNREVLEGNIIRYSSFECVKIGESRYIEPYTWEYVSDITIIEVLGERK